MRQMRVLQTSSLVAACAALAPVHGQVGDPQIHTDHPYFPGELAMSSPERCLDMAFRSPRGPLGDTGRDRIIRLFLWRAEHYAHLHSPMVYNLPGVVPDPESANELMIDYDAMRVLFSYGFGLCGTNHGQMRVFAEAAGWPLRRRTLNDDTGCELFVDGGWRYFNVDQYTLHFLTSDPGAHLASIDQVLTAPHHFIEWNPDLGLGYALPQANTHGSYQDVSGVTGPVPHRSAQWVDYWSHVWNLPAASSLKMVDEGYTATPIALALRRGETFTRWLEPDGVVDDLGLQGRAWWGFNTGGSGGGGPHANWSFVQNAPARDEVPGGPEESRSGQQYGNGAFQWSPDLSTPAWEDGLFERTGTFVSDGNARIRSVSGGTLVFGQYTPYAIAARPLTVNGNGFLDPAYPAADGAVLTLDALGSIGVSVSTNAGATWQAQGSLFGREATLDFTDAVKGRNQYLVRLAFDANEGLDALSLRTLVNVSQGVYPNLREGGTTVRYESVGKGALDLSPDLFSPQATFSSAGYAALVATSGNVSFDHYQEDTFALRATNAQPLRLTYRVELPPGLAERGATLRSVHAAVDASVYNSAPSAHETRIEVGPTVSGPWTEIAHNTVPGDNSLSHYWTYGKSPEAEPLGGTQAYVRFHHDDGPVQARIRFLRLYATYDLPSSSPLEVTYHWRESGAPRSARHAIRAGVRSDTWTIDTGDDLEQHKVVFGLRTGPGQPICFGDGSGTPCPCGNDSPVAGTGCLHSGGAGMTLVAGGSASLAADDLTLTALDAPAGNSGIFFAGHASLAPGIPLHDGLQCAGGSTFRFRPRLAQGGVVTDTGFVAQDAFGSFWSPGTTYVFQYFSRDTLAGASPCGALANLSSAYAMTMEL